MTEHFIPGLKLAERFYDEAVAPILAEHFPALPHAAALIGSGSEVLGFDDVMSSDHHWGPRVMLFLRADDARARAEAIRQILAERLPPDFLGYPTHFSEPDPDDGGVQHMRALENGPVNHRVETYTLAGFVRSYIGVDLDQPLTPADWLTLPEQKLRTLTGGAVFRDDIGLEAVRARFGYYPRDVWLYMLAAGWARIGQEEHLMGRAGLVGDEIGSNLIGARLVGDIMRLGFLMERTYAPYPKWFGSAFRQLHCAEALSPHLRRALRAETWPERERHLVPAYAHIAHMHNVLGLTDPVPAEPSHFHGRPFTVIAQNGFAEALLAQIGDPAVKAIAARPTIGGIDQFSDNTDLLENHGFRGALKQLFS